MFRGKKLVKRPNIPS